jgi:hypothetical protein
VKTIGGGEYPVGRGEMGASRKVHFVRTVLRPDKMPTKVAPAKLAELARRTAEYEAKPPKPK